jgi:hypothetical protein
MNVEVITREDLQVFRLQLINDIREIVQQKQPQTKEWLRSSEVKKLLKISAGTLQNLRISGKLKSSKIGGIHFYKYSEIETLLNSSSNQLVANKVLL